VELAEAWRVDMNTARIFFWNCGVAPLNTSSPSSENINLVGDFINDLFENHKADIIVMCEINNSSINEIVKRISSKNVKSVPLVSKASSYAYFDMIALTKDSIEIKEHAYIRKNNQSEQQEKIELDDDYMPSRGRTMKAGIDIVCEMSGIPDQFHIIASHWSSKSNGFSEENREESGERLKEYVSALTSNKRQVILVGDYNDNPNSISISKKLGAYVNRHYASIDKKRIYNPSLSFSSPHYPYRNGEEQHFHGTWLSTDSTVRTNQSTSCQVLDQVMVTASFIKSGPWHLDEKETKVVYNDGIIKMLYSGDIDHLPIMAKIDHHRV
jgi:exonuclease III